MVLNLSLRRCIIGSRKNGREFFRLFIFADIAFLLIIFFLKTSYGTKLGFVPLNIPYKHYKQRVYVDTVAYVKLYKDKIIFDGRFYDYSFLEDLIKRIRKRKYFVLCPSDDLVYGRFIDFLSKLNGGNVYIKCFDRR